MSSGSAVFEKLSFTNTHFGLDHPKGLPKVSKYSRITVVERLKKAKNDPTVLKFYEKFPPYCLNRNIGIHMLGQRCDTGVFDMFKSDPLFADQK